MKPIHTKFAALVAAVVLVSGAAGVHAQSTTQSGLRARIAVTNIARVPQIQSLPTPPEEELFRGWGRDAIRIGQDYTLKQGDSVHDVAVVFSPATIDGTRSWRHHRRLWHRSDRTDRRDPRIAHRRRRKCHRAARRRRRARPRGDRRRTRRAAKLRAGWPARCHRCHSNRGSSPAAWFRGSPRVSCSARRLSRACPGSGSWSDSSSWPR